MHLSFVSFGSCTSQIPSGNGGGRALRLAQNLQTRLVSQLWFLSVSHMLRISGICLLGRPRPASIWLAGCMGMLRANAACLNPARRQRACEATWGRLTPPDCILSAMCFCMQSAAKVLQHSSRLHPRLRAHFTLRCTLTQMPFDGLIVRLCPASIQYASGL